jgi:hypothetical protein
MSLKVLAIVWAAPYTILGIVIGTIGVASGGQVRLEDGVLEYHGRFIRWALDQLPLPGAQAMTLGHSVIARHQEALEVSRAHERVHVRQFERWGPFMGPAYLGCSAAQWMRGKDAYRDNPFEREAFAKS